MLVEVTTQVTALYESKRRSRVEGEQLSRPKLSYLTKGRGFARMDEGGELRHVGSQCGAPGSGHPCDCPLPVPEPLGILIEVLLVHTAKLSTSVFRCVAKQVLLCSCLSVCRRVLGGNVVPLNCPVAVLHYRGKLDVTDGRDIQFGGIVDVDNLGVCFREHEVLEAQVASNHPIPVCAGAVYVPEGGIVVTTLPIGRRQFATQPGT